MRSLPAYGIITLILVVLLYTQFGRIKTYTIPYTSPAITSSGPWLRDIRTPGAGVYAPHRAIDVQDTFAVDNFKQSPTCTLDSRELHEAFEPLCPDKHSLLEAMSNGGRAGQDMPFQPRGCDMRWFNTAEICDILSKFEQIQVLGDSVMLQTTVAMITLMRKDLINGGHATWLSDPPGVDCSCKGPYESLDCGYVVPVYTDQVWENDPGSMACPQAETSRIDMSVLLSHPLKQDDFTKPFSLLPKEKPKKPHVFIMGSGLWNDCSVPKTKLWVEQVDDKLTEYAPWLKEKNHFKKLFFTPNAAGLNKPEVLIEKQGNVALQRWEIGMKDWVIDQHGYDFIGTWNSTIQSSSPDGTHAGFRGNFLRAMMIFNWLAALDVSDW